MPELAVEALMSELRRPGIKQRDALRAVRLAAAGQMGAPTSRSERFDLPGMRAVATPQTGFLQHFKELSIGVDRTGHGRIPLGQAWSVAQVLHGDTPQFIRAVRLRFLLFSAALGSRRGPAASRVSRTALALEDLHRSRFGRALFPACEYLEEARIIEFSRSANALFGSQSQALSSVAERLRLDGPDRENCLFRLLSGQPDALPAWWLARTFSFQEAFRPALDVARDAREIHSCFLAWSSGSSVTLPSLLEIAAEIWRCSMDDVPAACAERALYEAPGASDGLRYALQLIAAAERLKVPINAYPESRHALRTTPLDTVLVAGRGLTRAS
jgi:hypothetical protein